MSSMPKKVLVCEDNPMNMVLIRDLLAVDGFEVIEAADGVKAIKLACALSPDLIIMDIQMPLMDGYETIAALRGNPLTARIVIIVSTSFAMVGDRAKALKAGANDYISKPIDTRLFRRMVNRLLADDHEKDEGDSE